MFKCNSYRIDLGRVLEAVKNSPYGCCNSHSIETPPIGSSLQRTSHGALLPLHNHILDIVVPPKYVVLVLKMLTSLQGCSAIVESSWDLHTVIKTASVCLCRCHHSAPNTHSCVACTIQDMCLMCCKCWTTSLL